MQEKKVKKARSNMRVKTLFKDSYGHICVRFPIVWEEWVKWLHKGQKVLLALSPEGDSINLSPSLNVKSGDRVKSEVM